MVSGNPAYKKHLNQIFNFVSVYGIGNWLARQPAAR